LSQQESPEAFRDRARTWVASNLPRAEGHGGNLEIDDEEKRRTVAEDKELQQAIFDAGFAGIRYPEQYGGQGLTREHQVAWHEATAGYRVPTTFTVTHGILGPTMLDFGTEEQKARHLPAMLSGRELWVQFLSEPSGGSDLAGLLTRAERDGEVFRLNGSKIWSTGAHFSDYCMVLARTNVDVPKHGGLSLFMMPIRSPGVTVTPIKLVTGGSHFCQEFFDDVQLDPSQLIGGENDGWRVASKLLFHERNMIGGNSLNDHAASGRDEADGDAIGELAAVAKAVGRADDSYTRQLIGEAVILQTLGEPTISRINALLRTGRMPESAASILRLMAGLTNYRLRQIAMEVAGTQGVMHGADDLAGANGQRWLAARISTVGGGSQEMQRNGISERVLGLPREATPDRGVPFSEVLASRRERG
jgi:alkylation response protein AidB-like acyl-CoA dehydrogenase